jgi:hypothetical protein
MNAFSFIHLWAGGDAFAHDLHALFPVGKPFAANGVPPRPLEDERGAGMSEAA